MKPEHVPKYMCIFIIKHIIIKDIMSTTITIIVENYIKELRIRKYAASTEETYSRVCRRLLGWCSARNITILTESVVHNYCKGMTKEIEQAGLKRKNVQHLQRVLGMLLSYQSIGDFGYKKMRRKYLFRTDIKKYINAFFMYCSERMYLSARTILRYKLELCRYDEYLWEQGLSLKDIKMELVEHFLASKPYYCRKSIKIALRAFYRYLYKTDQIDRDYSVMVYKEPRTMKPVKLPSTYSDEEIRRMIATIDTNSAIGKRNYLVFLLAAEYGLRASDIVNLSLHNIDWENNTISILQAKTGNPVQLPLLSSVGNAIIDYMQHGRPDGVDDTIIVSHDTVYKGRKITSMTIYGIVSNAIQQAKIANWQNRKHGPHALRHSLASNMLQQGVSLPVISTVLGHSSTETTNVYISVDINKLRQCGLPVPAIESPYLRKGVAL